MAGFEVGGRGVGGAEEAEGRRRGEGGVGYGELLVRLAGLGNLGGGYG